MSLTLSAELAATCNALGYFDENTNKYYADKNTLETAKDLIRYLRRDDDSHEIRRHLGQTQVLQTDLLPLLKNYWEEQDLFDVLLRLLVNLTNPALMLWHEKIPTEKTARNHYLQIEDHLQKYKQAFADSQIWAVLSTKLGKILEIDYVERGDENSLIIERILILIRNVLYVPANPDLEKRPDNDASIHDQVLWALHESGMLDIILFISSSATEKAYYMHVLEIISFMLREQNASELATAALQRSETEKMRDEAELLAIKHRETNQKQQKIKMYNGARHSRFGGTFVVKSMKSISNNELIYHKPLNKLETLNFDVDKKKPKTPKNRMPVQSVVSERRSAFSIRLFLKEFCSEFLNGAYNAFMYHVKDNLVRAKAQSHDESYYLWAMRFFMEFNRRYKFEVKLVSETTAIESFHFVQQQIENYFDTLTCHKKNFGEWSRRLHVAILAYRELFLTVCVMSKSSDETVRDSARVIQSNIFYVMEYREMLLTLLITFDELKLSKLYLNDLLETQHIFLKMFETYCDKFGSVVVQKKAKTKRKKKRAPAVTVSVPEINLEEEWDEAAPQLSAVLEGITQPPSNVVPFDAASDVPIDEQKSEAMRNIQLHLRQKEFEMALGLLRAAREVWPENDSFGGLFISPEEELLALQEIFFADLGENKLPNNSQPQEDDNIEDYENEDDEEMEGMNNFAETDFKFSDFTKRLASAKIVEACGLALKNFEQNSVYTNHCIVKLLHRIAFDLKMDTMLFQVSLFRTFQKICARQDMPQYEELAKFATYILRKFFALVPTNSKIFMELLFWKRPGECYDLAHGYGRYDESTRASRKAWTELEEEELRQLFMEHREKQITEDVVDWIVNNLIDNTRTRRGVLKQLKEMCLLTDYKGRGKAGISGKIPRQWGEDEEAQLRELYEQFKDAMDPIGCVMERLDVRRPKNRIVEKLLLMGLIQDKKEVRKKKTTSAREQPMQGDDDDILTSASDSDSDDDNNHRQRQRQGTSGTTQSSSPLSTTHLIPLLKNVSHMTGALEWLKESFSDLADDLEIEPNEDDEGIPLIAFTDDASSAMEESQFLALLKGFKIKKPANEQEIHWRIPSFLNLATLRQYCKLLTDTLENKLVEVEEQNGNKSESSDDEDVFDRVRRIANPNSVEPSASAGGSGGGNNEVHEHLERNTESSKENSREGSSDSEDNVVKDTFDGNHSDPSKIGSESLDDNNTTHVIENAKRKSAGTSKKKRIIIESDSEDESTERHMETSKESENVNQDSSGISLDNGGPRITKSRKNVILDSDSENDDTNPISVINSKNKRILESDEDEDENTDDFRGNGTTQISRKRDHISDTEMLSEPENGETISQKSKKKRLSSNSDSSTSSKQEVASCQDANF